MTDANCYYFCRNAQSNQKDGSIKFHPELAVFSNFENNHPIKLDDGRIALSGEHYFQALKHSENEELFNSILQAKTQTGRSSPALSKKLGRGSKKTGVGILTKEQVQKWNMTRNAEMYKVIMAKFSQHEDLKLILLGTGNSLLIENAPWDSYWGIGRNGKGLNMLGKTLMKVRDDIRESE